MNIVSAVILCTIVGAVGAIVLVAAAKFMAVEEDPRIEEVSACLAGANCGGCGYAGCADYAKAVVLDGVPCDKCAPGGPKAAAAIAKIMGGEASAVEKKAVVQCQGSSEHCKPAYDYKGIQTCAAAAALYGGPKTCSFACIGLGDCTKVCKFDAIHVENNVAVIDYSKCKNCTMCAKACPRNAIEPIPTPEEKEKFKAAQKAAAEKKAAAAKAAAEAAATEEDKKKDGGWFNKKAREMEAVKAKLDAAEKNAAQAKDQLLRMAAEYDNYRKRTAKEKESVYSDAKADTIKPFLAVYDNLERGIAQYDEADVHRQGLELILRQFTEALTKLGVTEIESQGVPFDPEKHNAVMHVEDENYGENTVVEVLQQGFTLGDKVLRFAIVKVAN